MSIWLKRIIINTVIVTVYGFNIVFISLEPCISLILTRFRKSSIIIANAELIILIISLFHVEAVAVRLILEQF